MTPPDDQLQDTLRTAFRQSAQDIPAVPPPLRLNPGRQLTSWPPRGSAHHRRWIAWLTPLAAAAVVVAVVAASLVLTRGVHRAPPGSPQPGQASSPQATLELNPQFSVTLLTNGKPAEFAVQAQIKSQGTGEVIATITPPKPYVMFTGVTAAADGQTFVLSAQVQPDGPWPAPGLTGQPARFYSAQARFFVLRIPLHAGSAGAPGITLQALPARFVPANTNIEDMALSPDGRSLATDLADATGSRLSVFDLVTGTSRTWSSQVCAVHQCSPSSGGLSFGGVNVDAVSWTGDGTKLLFFWGSQIRLLATAKPGTNLLANSKLIVSPPNAPAGDFAWRGAFISPDGRTVVAIEEFNTQHPLTGSQRLVTFSVATGRLTATLNRLSLNGPYEQVLWTDPNGGELVVADARGHGSLGYLVNKGHYIPVPSSARAVATAW